MRITMSTTPQEVAAKTMSVMDRNLVPNMLLKNEGKSDGFISDKKDFKYWLQRVCGRKQ